MFVQIFVVSCHPEERMRRRISREILRFAQNDKEAAKGEILRFAQNDKRSGKSRFFANAQNDGLSRISVPAMRRKQTLSHKEDKKSICFADGFSCIIQNTLLLFVFQFQSEVWMAEFGCSLWLCNIRISGIYICPKPTGKRRRIWRYTFCTCEPCKVEKNWPWAGTFDCK